MKSMIDQAFRRYGMTVTVEHGAETGETHGFVQPVTAVSGGEPFSVGPLGAADRRCWRYLGSAEVSVAQGDHILCEGKQLPRPPRGEREARRSGDALLGGA